MEKRAWPKKLTGPKHDVEAGIIAQRRQWREPDEMSEDSVEVMYHQASKTPPRPEQLGVLGKEMPSGAHLTPRMSEI